MKSPLACLSAFALYTFAASVSAVSPITTHVLDAKLGLPGSGVPITLKYARSSYDAAKGDSRVIARCTTDADGRCNSLLPDSYVLKRGVYTVHFDIKTYTNRLGDKAFYPFADITFEIETPAPHYHIPLNLAPYSFTTYRGS
ncbi:transthyretin family protein [Linderina pennispora]|uniref:5-hydroxyisourate hydrolase n=1 Tax=Linderina pennispora TaxID=61395 RepID=A0A1Y1WFQ8_9FUNG|nr:transthyretin family protein [Linderina pennispora]ORX72327.1 transthyretin family protein [Linderina pennispora]